MKRIVLFCLVTLAVYILAVIALNLPQKTQVITKESTITIPTPSSTQPSGTQKPNLNL